MKPVAPSVTLEGGTPVVLGANQPEYMPLPAVCGPLPDRTYLTEWELSAEDLALLLDGGRIRLWQHTFGSPFQPVALEVVKEGE